MRHAGDDKPEARPRIEPVAHEPQLGRVVGHEHGGERGAEAAATGVERDGGHARLARADTISPQS
jgi:hypothetical protein